MKNRPTTFMNRRHGRELVLVDPHPIVCSRVSISRTGMLELSNESLRMVSRRKVIRLAHRRQFRIDVELSSSVAFQLTTQGEFGLLHNLFRLGPLYGRGWSSSAARLHQYVVRIWTSLSVGENETGFHANSRTMIHLLSVETGAWSHRVANGTNGARRKTAESAL